MKRIRVYVYLGVSEYPLPGVDVVVLVLDRDLPGHIAVEGGAPLGGRTPRPLHQLGRVRVTRLQRILQIKKLKIARKYEKFAKKIRRKNMQKQTQKIKKKKIV